MNITPLLSIIIPTCDRAELVAQTVKTYVQVNSPEVELIVSDNYSSPETKASIQHYIDNGSIQYIRPSKRLSMPDHWEFAYPHARGQYILVNCDDNIAILPSYLQRVLQLLHDRNPGLLSWQAASYYYPDWVEKKYRNHLDINRVMSGYLYQADPATILRLFAKLDITPYPHTSALLFSKQLGDLVQKKYGRLFWPYAPDYTAPALMLTELKKLQWLHIDSNLGFFGNSGTSNNASMMKEGGEKSAKRKKEFKKEFEGADIFPFHTLKVPILGNIYIGALFLAKHLNPIFFEKNPCPVDYQAFAYRSVREVLELDRKFPILESGDMKRLEVWFNQQAPGVWDSSMKCIQKMLQRPTKSALVPSSSWESIDAISRAYNSNVILDCSKLGIENTYDLQQMCLHLFKRYSIASWEIMSPYIDQGLYTPLGRFEDLDIPSVSVDRADLNSTSVTNTKNVKINKIERELRRILRRSLSYLLTKIG
ncbi:MAG: hypothetical protein S4CHLAM81_06260 [Chlamydiales bacterium]|nr:hypothetical protein [Chlamydiales bacterium]MCH9635410.1 hypothetical protein [Chlamydiales bacterium]MCH9703580.1 glycosyltransferase family 2 protein [Chlamydiota bacterium]